MMNESPPLVLYGARDAVALGLSHIEEHVIALERAVAENPGLAFDLAKTLIESTCRTILRERGITCSVKDDLPKLFKTTTNSLPFLPPSVSNSIEARNSLTQTLNGLNTAMNGVRELRNACGFASHGSEAQRPALESVQAILAAKAADTIVGFFYRVHMQDRQVKQIAPGVQARNADFDEYVDDQHSVRIFAEDFPASKVLFELAPTPYAFYLSEYLFDKASGIQDDKTQPGNDEGQPKSKQL